MIPVVCLGLILYGVICYLFDHEKNMCEMTYMFELPEYVKVPLKREVSSKYPRYNLYIYGEGKYAEELRANKFSGIPVLFVPGNAGSYRQARSIGSVAMRMGHSLRATFHFNIFTIDFREEISALYGGVVDEQTAFVKDCITHIQSLYSVKKKLMLIGHSMGGVLCRAVFAIPHFDPTSVSAIYTLATPHKEPVLTLDAALVAFYKKVSDTWKNYSNSKLSRIPIVSLSGGDRDYVVRSELTSLNFYPSMEFQAVSTAIPGVWVSTDHLAIVWCKQMVLALTRSMFDLIDIRTKQVTVNMTLIQEIMVHHFIQRNYGTNFPKLPFLPSTIFAPLSQWIQQEESSWRFSRMKILTTVYIMVPLLKGEQVVIIASGLAKEDWIYACTSNSLTNEAKTCLTGDNISKQGKVIPSKNKRLERRMVIVSSSELMKKGYSHILVLVSPTNSQVDLLGERYKVAERHKHFSLPSIFERMVSFSQIRIVSFLLTDRGVFYNLTFSGLSSVVETTTFILETRICRAGSTISQGIINLHIPWSNEDVFYHVRTTLGGTTAVPVKLHNLPPKNALQNIQMHLVLDPECSYVLFATFPLSNIISQFIKFYGLLIPGYCVALYLSILSGQMYAIGAKGTCPSPLYILGKFPTYLSLVLLPSLLYYGIWVTGFGPGFIPFPDDLLFEESSIYSIIFLRSVLYVISYGVVVSCNFCIMKTVSFISYVWMCFKKKSLLEVTETPLEAVPKENLKISRGNVICFALLSAVAIGVGGSVSIAVGLYFYCSKFFTMLLKCRAEEERRGYSAATSKWHFHTMLTILWVCAVIITLPGIVVWAKNLSFSLKLVNDPHLIPCLALILSSGLLWQLPIPFHHRVFYRTASHIIHFIAVLVTLYGIKSIFRLLYFISMTFAVISVQQLVALICSFQQLKLD